MRYQVWLPDEATEYLFKEYDFAQEFAKQFDGYVIDKENTSDAQL